MSEFVSATFRDPETAAAAVDRLAANGYRVEEVNVVMSARWRETYFAAGHEANGGPATTRLSMLVGKVKHSLAPGRHDRPERKDDAFLAGPIASALGSARSNASAGNVLRALFGAISDTELRELTGDLERGAIIVGVRARSEDIDEARRIVHTTMGDRRETASVN
jgi:hypothetical protein